MADRPTDHIDDVDYNPEEEENWLYSDSQSRERDEDAWFCEFPDRCLMPGRHMRSECYTREMAEEWERENLKDSE